MDEYGAYVTELHYQVELAETFEYEDPSAVEFENSKARFYLDKGELTVTLKQEHRTGAEARWAILPVLDAWEAAADLQYTPDEFRFRFVKAEFAFRNPPPKGTVIPGVANRVMDGIAGELLGSSAPPLRTAYPSPPGDFVLSPDAAKMHERIVGYMHGRESLPSAAYYCLTVIEELADSRKDAARLLNIDMPVLQNLGELCGEHGGAMGRKAAPDNSPAGVQVTWLREALRKLTLRVGEHASGITNLAGLTMADLPKL